MAGDDLFDVNFGDFTDEEISMTEINAEETSTEETASAAEESSESTQETEKKEETQEAEDSIEIESLNDLKNIENSSEEEAEQAEEDSKDEESDSDNEGPDLGEDSSPVTPFASLLHEKGFLPNINWEEFNSAEDKIEALAQAMNAELAYANQAFINSFPPELIDMAKAVASGVPLDSIKDAKVQELNYSSIEEDKLTENTSLQKRLVSEYLQAKGFKQNKIDSYVEKFEDMGTLEDEAKDALGELQEYAKQQQEQAKQAHAERQKQLEEQHAQTINKIKEDITGTEEIIPGIKMNKTVKDRLFNNMTQMTSQDNNGNPVNYIMETRAKDPIKFDMAVTYLADITKGFTDWSKLGKTAKSTAAKDLEKALANSKPIVGKPKKAPKTSDSEPDLGDDFFNSLSKL
jgi:hypothetical protein